MVTINREIIGGTCAALPNLLKKFDQSTLRGDEMGKHVANGPCRAFGIDFHLPLIIMQTREDGNKLFTLQLELFSKCCDFRHLNFSSTPVFHYLALCQLLAC